MKLAPKILLLIVGVLMLGFGASTILNLRRQADLLMEQSKAAARWLATTIVASVEAAMLQERPDVTRALLEEMRGATPGEGLTIVRRNGAEAFTDLATVEEVRRNAELSPQVEEHRDGPLFVLHHPIPDQRRCQGCHGADHQVRAVVRVATSMAPVFAELRQHRNRQILLAALTIVAVGCVLTVAPGRVVVQPLRTLAGVARRIGDGDFAARAPAASPDEIGALATALNDMTVHLAGAYRDLEARNVELATALQDLGESRQQLALVEQLKDQRSRFVPDGVKRLLERDPSATELEKRSAEVSVLFLDMDARRLNQLIQLSVSAFLEIVQDHHGDVNETAGDGLMVIFQSERSTEDHALDATRAALAIQQRATALTGEYEGTFPGVRRWTFTATGPITAERIRHHVVLQALGEQSLKNVSASLRLYRVIPPGVYDTVA